MAHRIDANDGHRSRAATFKAECIRLASIRIARDVKRHTTTAMRNFFEVLVFRHVLSRPLKKTPGFRTVAGPVKLRNGPARTQTPCCDSLPALRKELAFYRTARQFADGWNKQPLIPSVDFWRTVSNNFLDTCVLEWCKLLGDEKAAHGWENVISDKTKFKSELLTHLKVDDAKF